MSGRPYGRGKTPGQVMGPGRNWSFVAAFASKIRARRRPARDKRNLQLSDELLGLGLRLIEAAQPCGHPRTARR